MVKKNSNRFWRGMLRWMFPPQTTTQQPETRCVRVLGHEPLETRILMAADVNLVVNGSFEQHVVSHKAGWNIYRSIPGWTLTSGPSIEIQRGILGGAAEGAQHVELDSDQNGLVGKNPKKERGSSAISSAPIAVEPGRVYEYSFQAKARPGTGAADNIIGARVIDRDSNTTLKSSVTQLTPGGNWQTFRENIKPNGTQLVLSFADRGVNNTLGTFLDNVQLKLLPVSGDLDILPNGTTPIDESEELNPGGFVTLNYDDDNGNNVSDNQETGAVAGENDLVPLIMRQAVNSGASGQYALEFDSNFIRVWKDVNKTELVISNSFDFDAQVDTLVYAEAFEPSNTGGLPDSFKLLWKAGYNSESKVLDEVGLSASTIGLILFNAPIAQDAGQFSSGGNELIDASLLAMFSGYGQTGPVNQPGAGPDTASAAGSASGAGSPNGLSNDLLTSIDQWFGTL